VAHDYQKQKPLAQMSAAFTFIYSMGAERLTPVFHTFSLFTTKFL
jgi:hypothetical protein